MQRVLATVIGVATALLVLVMDTAGGSMPRSCSRKYGRGMVDACCVGMPQNRGGDGGVRRAGCRFHNGHDSAGQHAITSVEHAVVGTSFTEDGRKAHRDLRFEVLACADLLPRLGADDRQLTQWQDVVHAVQQHAHAALPASWHAAPTDSNITARY